MNVSRRSFLEALGGVGAAVALPGCCSMFCGGGIPGRNGCLFPGKRKGCIRSGKRKSVAGQRDQHRFRGAQGNGISIPGSPPGVQSLSGPQKRDITGF